MRHVEPYRWYSLDDIEEFGEQADAYLRAEEDRMREQLAWALQGVAEERRRCDVVLWEAIRKYAPDIGRDVPSMILSEGIGAHIHKRFNR